MTSLSETITVSRKALNTLLIVYSVAAGAAIVAILDRMPSLSIWATQGIRFGGLALLLAPAYRIWRESRNAGAQSLRAATMATLQAAVVAIVIAWALSFLR